MSELVYDELMWIEVIEVARFLNLPVVHLVNVPARYIEEILIIVRARRQ
ncbi:MAG TPA: hypothetical protein VL866_24035 [Pyrinomonadaceae bacterium]|nr:hypothetical protein [Pyrinomonadaceae bacterium]